MPALTLPPVSTQRRWPIGAEVVAPEQTAFRVWAPQRQRVAVVLEGNGKGRHFDLDGEGNGYFSAVVEAGPARAIAFPLTAKKRSIPTPFRGSSPRGRTARPRWSIRGPLPGPTRTGKASARAGE